MTGKAGSLELVVRRPSGTDARVIEFRDPYLNYERTDELKPKLLELVESEMADGCRRLVLDLSRLQVVDSCGLAVLVSLEKKLRAGGATLAISGASEMIHRLFELTGSTRSSWSTRRSSRP
jgi:anti-sigma B factor antagonist